MSTVGGNQRKLNTTAQLQTFLYPTVSKSYISVLQRLHGQIGRTNFDVQKRDGQTKNSTFFATPAAGEMRALPNLAW